MIFLDFETRSRVDLKKCGSSVYARDPSTSILCLAWGREPSEVYLWTPDQAKPQPLLDAITWGEEIEAHNVGFERNIWRWICHARLGWPDVKFEQWRCSLAACSRLTLPRSLGDAGEALDVTEKKDADGHKIMMRLSKPIVSQSTGGDTLPMQFEARPEYDNDPRKLQSLYDYCIQDVRAEMAIAEAIPPLTDSELLVWQLDQRINLRGLAVDREAIKASLKIVDQTYSDYCEQIRELTGGYVTTPKQAASIIRWLASLSPPVLLPDITVESVDEALGRDDLPAQAREILSIRQAASKASTGKLKAMLDRCDSDGRVRGNLVYHGAATGRWAGAGIQIQNYPRGTLSPAEIEIVHRMLPARDGRFLDLLLAPPIDCISSCLRSMVRASAGSRLLVCDFASIEARVLAWLAGQEDLLVKFAAGGDVYKGMASRIYEVDELDITKPQRHLGKTAILGLGYGMGYKAFQLACKVMAGIEIDRAFAKRVVKLYREANEHIKKLWSDVGAAAIKTVESGQPHRVGRLEFRIDGRWLKIKLPSGRDLHYRDPDIEEVLAPWSEGYVGTIYAAEDMAEKLEGLDIELGERCIDCWEGCIVPKVSVIPFRRTGIKHDLKKQDPQYIKQLTYMGTNSMTRKWVRLRTYGGKLVENVTQAVARDFLAESMMRVERDGYPIVATVHDEIICEREIGEGSLEEFEGIMRKVPKWGSGCPIEVEGFESERYRK